MLILLAALTAGFAGPAAGEQSSQPASPEAGFLDAGGFHSCAVQSFRLHCWGYGGAGELGYGGTRSVGDDETPRSVGPVDFGGRNVTAVSTGDFHTCALLEDATVHCWGFGGNGRLGYGNEASILAAGDAGPVFLGEGRSAKAISAGSGHTCAVLDNDRVLCWGFGIDGRLGLNATDDVGDNELPGERGPIDFGALDGAKAVSTGDFHTCALLLNDTVRCWGFGGAGRLGYGNQADVGRGCLLVGNVCTPTPEAPSPASVGPIDLGEGRTAKALTSGGSHNCVILDNDAVRCWGSGTSGHLGYGNDFNVGDNEVPGARGPVDLGQGRTARAIAAGGDHVCAVLDDASVRCWGSGGFGRLGYGNDRFVGLDDTPGSVAPVNLGAGRGAKAITAGAEHTCARLDDDSVRCWGSGRQGRLGYCSERNVGDDETPGSLRAVDLGQPGIAGQACRGAPAPPRTGPPPTAAGDPLPAALAAQGARAALYSSCRRSAKRKARVELRKARRLPSSRRRSGVRRVKRRAARRRRACVRRHGRVPGRVTDLTVRATGTRRIELSFSAPGTDGARPPAARSYLVKQSRRRIRSARGFARAPSLCKGRCSFNITRVGAKVNLTITRARRRAVYYFAVRARDNVTRRTGPRSKTVRVRVR